MYTYPRQARHQKVVDRCNWWPSSVLVWLSLTSIQIDLRLSLIQHGQMSSVQR
ncbi:hypothetical protein J3E68DRAFT_358248 [Trichoderma sp. SZMC 28012]